MKGRMPLSQTRVGRCNIKLSCHADLRPPAAAPSVYRLPFPHVVPWSASTRCYNYPVMAGPIPSTALPFELSLSLTSSGACIRPHFRSPLSGSTTSLSASPSHALPIKLTWCLPRHQLTPNPFLQFFLFAFPSRPLPSLHSLPSGAGAFPSASFTASGLPLPGSPLY